MYDASTYYVCLQSKDGTHYVTVQPIEAPSGGYQSRATCICGWATTQLFGQLAQAASQAHLKAIEATR